MKGFKITTMLLAAAIAVGAWTGTGAAQEAVVKILAPWQARGEVYKVAPNKVKVVAIIDGIMYVDKGDKSMDAAVFMCPGVEYINLDNDQATLEADCMISGGKDKVAYATLKASGKVGSLEGDFNIVGGEKKWKGMKGAGKVSIRTAMGSIAKNAKTGEVLNAAAGLAVWPGLKVTLPGK